MNTVNENDLAWKAQNNSILIDIETYDFKIHNRTRGRLRIYLGKLTGDSFEVTVDTIKNVDAELDSRIRQLVKYIILGYLKHQPIKKLAA